MKISRPSWAALSGLLVASGTVNAAVQLDLTSVDSIKQAAKTVATGMTQYYTGNRPGDIPGNLPAPYYWWEAGAMFGTLVDYWYYTGDTTFNDITTQALLFQVGPNADYMPPNQTKDEGNDDQSFWGMAALSAAEAKYPDPPPGQPQWLALAQGVFNTQAPRWDAATCGGGLRWQIFTFNNGYNYKNTISNGCFFNIAARLGRYTGNQTYVEWAEKMWDWVAAVGLMSSDYHFYDGSDDTINCTQVNHIEWSYNTGVYLLGAATMWNMTQDPKWKTRIDGILETSALFFTNNVMKEVACEDNGKCDVDQRSFKAYLSRWMAATTKLAPWTTDTIMTRLAASAKAATSTCTGGADGNQCGLKWTTSTFDGSLGVGEQMSVLEVIQSNLISEVAGPVTNATGGTSKGNPSAGSGAQPAIGLNTITTSDKAGAGILTMLVLITTFGGSWWMASK
jgi:mannan endo-1,6-alpha-mannosidase